MSSDEEGSGVALGGLAREVVSEGSSSDSDDTKRNRNFPSLKDVTVSRFPVGQGGGIQVPSLAFENTPFLSRDKKPRATPSNPGFFTKCCRSVMLNKLLIFGVLALTVAFALLIYLIVNLMVSEKVLPDELEVEDYVLGISGLLCLVLGLTCLLIWLCCGKSTRLKHDTESQSGDDVLLSPAYAQRQVLVQCLGEALVTFVESEASTGGHEALQKQTLRLVLTELVFEKKLSETTPGHFNNKGGLFDGHGAKYLLQLASKALLEEKGSFYETAVSGERKRLNASLSPIEEVISPTAGASGP